MATSPTEERSHQRGDGAEGESALDRLSPGRLVILVAVIATVIGAGVGTATTLLVGDPGPAGERGERGATGPRGAQGPQGPPGDTSAAEAAVADLEAQVDELSARVDELEMESPTAGDLTDLKDRVSELESLVSDLCAELELDC